MAKLGTNLTAAKEQFDYHCAHSHKMTVCQCNGKKVVHFLSVRGKKIVRNVGGKLSNIACMGAIRLHDFIAPFISPMAKCKF